MINNSLAKGAELNADTFADFLKRLHHDCVGQGVAEHGTADALFIVERKVIVSGLDRDYTDDLLVYHDEQTWFSPKEYWDDQDEEWQAKLDGLADECDEGKIFLELGISDQWDILEELDDHTVTAYAERWDYVNSHFTKDAAEAFIARKKHDYRDGLRVYVESQYWAWEFNAIKKALLNGTLQFVSVPKTSTVTNDNKEVI
jgi:hypothetical protein